MDINKLSIKELENLKIDINIKIGDLSNEKKDKYYLHVIKCKIHNYSIKSIVFTNAYIDEFFTEEELIDGDFKIPFVETHGARSTSNRIEVSLYSKSDKATSHEKNLLYKEMLSEINKFKTIFVDDVERTLKHNEVQINQEFKNYLRSVKLKNLQNII